MRGNGKLFEAHVHFPWENVEHVGLNSFLLWLTTCVAGYFHLLISNMIQHAHEVYSNQCCVGSGQTFLGGFSMDLKGYSKTWSCGTLAAGQQWLGGQGQPAFGPPNPVVTRLWKFGQLFGVACCVFFISFLVRNMIDSCLTFCGTWFLWWKKSPSQILNIHF